MSDDAVQELYRQVFAASGDDRFAGIRAIRERFGLDLARAKEVMLQAEGAAGSLSEHQGSLAKALEEAFREK